MTSRVVAALALLTILAGAIFYNLNAQKTPAASQQPAAPQISEPEKPIVVETPPSKPESDEIRAVGVVKADRQATISTLAPGRIVEVAVRNGARVRAGDLLVRLEVGGANAQVSEAQAGIDAARAQLRKTIDGRSARKIELDSDVSQAETGVSNAKVKLQQAVLGAQLQTASATSDSERAKAAVLQAEAGVRSADLALEQAEKTLKRVEFLFSKGGAPRVELEGAVSQAKVARSQREGAVAALRQAQAAEKPAVDAIPLRDRVSKQDIEAAQFGLRNAESALATARKARSEALRIADRDVEAAEAAVRQAEAGREGARFQAAASLLTSPINGTATQVGANAGEIAQPGQPLMTVVSSDVYVEVSVPLRSALRIRQGDRASVSVESDSAPLPAVVSELLPVSGVDGRSVPVKVKLRSQVRLSPGLSVTVTIRPARKP
jgi:membrane fusion protein (multidrug efflux system)